MKVESQHRSARSTPNASRAAKAVTAALAGMVLIGAPATARAQFAVIDAAAVAQLVSSVGNQVKQLAMQTQQLKAQLDAMKKLSNPPWRTINAAVNQINTLMASAQSLGYQLASINGTFQSTFPVVVPIANWPVEQRNQILRTVETMRGVVLTLQEQSQTIPTGLARLQQLKSDVGSSLGHQQALEALNVGTLFVGEELLLLRQAVMAQANADAVFYANEANAQMQRDLTVRATVSAMAQPTTGAPGVSLRVIP